MCGFAGFLVDKVLANLLELSAKLVLTVAAMAWDRRQA